MIALIKCVPRPLSDPAKQQIMSLLRDGAAVLNPPVTKLAPLS